jgi:epoxide hydrolase-like predicted phosphatase
MRPMKKGEQMMIGGDIQALVFDYGGVLMRTVNPTPRREIEQRLGLPAGSVDDLVFGSSLWDEVQLGRVSVAEFWTDVARRMGLGAEGLKEFRQAFWAGDRLDDELVALIRHLRDAGYRTALLSNAPAGMLQHLERLGIANAFDAVIISGREGLMKPDRAIFERALARLGVEAEGAIFVDDTWANVVAADQAGLRAVQFRGLPPLCKWLKDLGLPVPSLDPVPVSGIQALIFDWGGVLESTPGASHVTDWERRLALQPGMLAGVLWGELWRDLSVGAITNAEYTQRVGDRLGFPDVETARCFIEEFYAANQFHPEVADAVRTLRGRYGIALLSNAFPGHDDLVRERHGFDVYAEFDVYVNSAYVGLRKPDPAIFYLTLEKLGVAPHQAVLLDDRLPNVDSARELGIHVLQFVDPATSLAGLEMLLGHPIG